MREVGSPLGKPQQLGKNHLYYVRVGRVSLCSQVLLLPLGVPPMAALASSTQNPSQDSGIWRVLTITNMGNVTQGQGNLGEGGLSNAAKRNASHRKWRTQWLSADGHRVQFKYRPIDRHP